MILKNKLQTLTRIYIRRLFFRRMNSIFNIQICTIFLCLNKKKFKNKLKQQMSSGIINHRRYGYMASTEIAVPTN